MQTQKECTRTQCGRQLTNYLIRVYLPYPLCSNIHADRPLLANSADVPVCTRPRTPFSPTSAHLRRSANFLLNLLNKKGDKRASGGLFLQHGFSLLTKLLCLELLFHACQGSPSWPGSTFIVRFDKIDLRDTELHRAVLAGVPSRRVFCNGFTHILIKRKFLD